MNKNRKTPLTLLAVSLLLPFSSYGQIPGLEPARTWDLNGYVKYMATATLPDQGDNLLDHLLHQRFNFEYRINPQLRFNAGMRNRYIYGDSAEFPFYADYIGLDPGYMDLSKNWSEGGKYVGNSQFDRLYLHWQKDDWVLRGGRFRINWGMTTVWNPNDVFNSYSVYDFDYEERPGSDAVLVSRKLGFASNLDLVFSPAQDSDLNSYSMRYLFNTNQWDIQLLGGKSGLDNFIGAGVAGEFKGAGLRAEVSYFNPTEKNWQNQIQVSSTVSSIEADYSFSGVGNRIVRAALLHISEPQDVQSAAAYLGLPLTAKTLSFTEFTTYMEAGFDTSPLNRITLSGIIYQDGSYFLGLSDSYSLADNWQLLGVVQYFDGDSDSLFGDSASTLLFAQIKWSF